MIRVLLDAILWNWMGWDRMEIYQQRICALIAIIACAHNTNSFNDIMNVSKLGYEENCGDGFNPFNLQSSHQRHSRSRTRR